MYTGPNRLNAAQHNDFQSIKAFHSENEQALDLLIDSATLNPAQLTSFVKNYKWNFESLFPNAKLKSPKTIDLFNKAGKQYLKLYTDQLRLLKNDPKKSINELSILLQQFIDGFPGEKESLIHYQELEEFKFFSMALIDALQKKRGTDGRYNKDKGHCVETLLLQNLAMLPIAISEKARPMQSKPKKSSGAASNSQSSDPSSRLTSYGELVAEFIFRTTSFFNNPKERTSGKALTMTLAALSYFDIEAFATYESDGHPFMPTMLRKNHPIDGFVDSCLRKLHKVEIDHNPEVIIRTIHAILLLSPSTDLRKYLDAKTAGALLSNIQNISLDTTKKGDRSLANQLFIIKNNFPDIFPAKLEQVILPFTSVFQQQAHGSRFENEVQNDLYQAACQLNKQYPGLIDHRHFDFNNPISSTLGLESDVTYQDNYNKVCLQVDGMKYHRYLGSGRETQRTMLRDHCFTSQAWSLVKFSDDAKGIDYATAQLKSNIVIPTYERKTAENIKAVKLIASTLGTLLKEIQQVTVSEDQAKELETLQQLTKEVTHFDNTAAQKLANYNHELNLLKATKSEKEIKIARLKEELQSLEVLIEPLEKKIETDTQNIRVVQAELNTFIPQQSELARELKKYEDQKKGPKEKIDSRYTRQQLIEEIIPGIRAKLHPIEQKIQQLQHRLKADTASLAQIRNTLENKKSSFQKLTKQYEMTIDELQETQKQLDHLETQLAAPVVGTALRQLHEDLLSSIARTKAATPSLIAEKVGEFVLMPALSLHKQRSGVTSSGNSTANTLLEQKTNAINKLHQSG